MLRFGGSITLLSCLSRPVADLDGFDYALIYGVIVQGDRADSPHACDAIDYLAGGSDPYSTQRSNR